jgi:hypothetical protein
MAVLTDADVIRGTHRVHEHAAAVARAPVRPAGRSTSAGRSRS